MGSQTRHDVGYHFENIVERLEDKFNEKVKSLGTFFIAANENTGLNNTMLFSWCW